MFEWRRFEKTDIVGDWHLAALKGQPDTAVDDGNLSEALLAKLAREHA